jgi:hypothetical protein
MEAPRRGNGADFDWSKPYRMYHGDKIPGFPSHPHRGFETLTITLEGLVDHCDSLGASGRYGIGDNQWMTAGSGVQHQEMFPLIHEDKPNTLKLYQLWLNLPAKNKMCPPSYVMHWAEDIPVVSGDKGDAKCLVYAGNVNGKKGGTPPPHSWASDEANDVAVLVLQIPPQSSFTLPKAKYGNAVKRTAYLTQGGSTKNGSILIGGKSIPAKSMIVLDAGVDVTFVNNYEKSDDGKDDKESLSHAEILILQGRPINEPVAQRGPFVMNSQTEIMEAFRDYQRTQFGGWNWPNEIMVFPRETKRFAGMVDKIGDKVRMTYPPSKQ